MFKFYTITSEKIIEKLIGANATIKLSSVFLLNDPYELKFNLDIDPLAEGHEEEYFKNNPGKTREDFLSWQSHVLNHDGYTWYREQEQRNAIAQEISLCSFTESNENNLMWSHYTDNHKGICIEYKPELFEYLKTLKGYIVFGKVAYLDNPPTVKSLEDINSKVEKIMFSKQTEWRYEKEHRIIFFSKNDTDYLPIDHKYIRAVYTGSRIDYQLEKKIINLCEKHSIELFQGITLGKTYKVSFNKYKKGTFYQRAFWRE